MSMDALKKFKTSADLPPVMLLGGQERFLIEYYTHRLIDMAVPTDLRDFNVDVLDAGEVDAGRVLDIARSFPMMAERRVLVVRDIQKMATSGLKELVRYAGQPNPSTVCIFTASDMTRQRQTLAALQKVAFFLPCKPLYENQVGDWIRAAVREQGYEIEPAAASLLALQVGTNLLDLHNELEKIYLYLGERRRITEADVAAVAGTRKEYSVFALQNSLGERNLREALRIYRVLKTQKPPQVILSWLSRFFVNLLVAYDYGNDQAANRELAQITGVSPFFVRDLHRFKRRYNFQEIQNALENLRQVDYSLKNYAIDEGRLLEQALVQIVKGWPATLLPYAAKN